MIVVPVAALDLSEFSTKNVKNTFSTPIFEKSEEPNAENSDTVKVMAKADSSKFKKADSKSLKRYIGLNEKDYSEVVYLMPSSTMEVSELLIVKVKNEAQADAIESAVNNRVETQENSFKDYAPEQYAVLQNSSVLIKGNYVFYVVSDNVEDMKNEFLDTIK